MAVDEEVVKAEMEGIKPAQERGFGDFVNAHEEIRHHRTRNAEGERAYIEDVARVGKQENNENGENGIGCHIGERMFASHFTHAIIIRNTGVAVRNHVDEQVGKKAKNEPEDRMSDRNSDDSSHGGVCGDSHGAIV